MMFVTMAMPRTPISEDGSTLHGRLARVVSATALLCLSVAWVFSCRTAPGVPEADRKGRECLHTLDCADGYFCRKAPGACGGAGVCSEIQRDLTCPETTEEWVAVCGCNGRTYLDPCLALKEGINIAREGECAQGLFGTCMSNDDCADTFFCDRFFGDCAGEGICEPVPAACEDESGEVCGCDGTTYTNICAAKGNGVSIAHGGPCRSR